MDTELQADIFETGFTLQDSVDDLTYVGAEFDIDQN